MSCVSLLVSLLVQMQLKKIAGGRKKRTRTLWARLWLMRRDEGLGASHLVINELRLENPAGFKHFTRMTISTFEFLLTKVAPRIQKQNTIIRESIPASTRLLVTLRYLATVEKFSSLQYTFRISVSALTHIIPETCEAINEALTTDYLKTPITNNEWKTIAMYFYKIWNFPFCIGALDGKHIAFRALKSDGAFYYNYKGFNSIVLLALVVDGDYNFLYINAGVNGRASDGAVYEKSGLAEAIQNNISNIPEDNYLPGTNVKVPYVIVADDAFKATRHLMKSWGLRTSKQNKNFNYRLSRARRIVENAFGILSNKFQIIQSEITLDVRKVELITITCCVLHNFIKKEMVNHIWQE